MTDQPPSAFADLATRAAATDTGPPPDRISMTEHLREVEIGAFQTERGTRQRLRFDVVVEVATRAERAADDVDRILSYDTIVTAIDAALAAGRVDLLETLAARIAEGVLAHPLARRVFLRIGKLDRGPYVLGVEIERRAPDLPEGRTTDPAPQPLVVFLSHAAAARADLSAFLDRLTRLGPPVILVTDAPPGDRPQAGAPLPQRRIDLLALEQGAWQLAARDPRCVVVATRTELDWALRQGRISVWAPSKLVLDASDDPAPAGADPMRLALWLAARFSACQVLSFGGDLPEDAGKIAPGVPLRTRPADADPSAADLAAAP